MRYLIHEKGLNQEGLRRLLALIPCWEIKGCPEAAQACCPARQDRRSPCWDLARRAGDESKRCYACDVYLNAREQVLGKAEMQEALNYTPGAAWSAEKVPALKRQTAKTQRTRRKS